MANNSAVGNSFVPFGNENEGNGGAFAAYGNSMINISKSIIWGNVATNNQQMSPNNGAVVSIDSSNVEGLPSAFFGNGNIDENPNFVIHQMVIFNFLKILQVLIFCMVDSYRLLWGGL